MDTWQKYVAELLGTFVLVFGGTVAILGATGSGLDLIVVPFAFGLALLAGLYAFGEVSGGHFNPAVSVADASSCRTLLTRLDTGHHAIASAG